MRTIFNEGPRTIQVLRREIPMAWGTTTESLTPEINPFQYARETKYLTLKDHDSYLISDVWCRSPLSFPTPTCIYKLLPQQSANKTRMLYIFVLDLFYHIWSITYKYLKSCREWHEPFLCVMTLLSLYCNSGYRSCREWHEPFPQWCDSIV